MKLLQSLTARQKLMIGGSVLAVIVVAFLLMRLAGSPSYSLVATGLDPSTTGKMTAALDSAGVSYELRNNGTALAVQKAQTGQARVALGEAGLSTTGTASDAFASFNDLKMGASSMQQQVAYQQALESQIAQTIGNVDGVSSAQVSLTMPEDQLFSDDAKQATAAVLLTGDTSTLDAGAVRGIANLVASSVEGLKPANVTITDSTGQMLWPTGDDATDTGTLSKQTAQSRYDANEEASLNALLVRMLGPGKAEVQVSADLNVDKTTMDKLQYDKKGTPLKQTVDQETLKSNGSSGGAASGTASNVPGYAAAGGSSGGKSNYVDKKTDTEFGVGKTVSHTDVAPGAVNRQSVMLTVDKSIPAAEVRQLQNAVASAAGIDTQRGDTMSVSQLTFAKQPAAPSTGGPLGSDGIVGYAKYALLGVGALLFLFFVTRALRRRENEVLTDPAWLRQLEAPMPIAELTDAGPPPSLVAAANPRKRQIEEVVTKEPERVATALRTWMNEG